MSVKEVNILSEKLLNHTLHVKDLTHYPSNILRAIGKTLTLKWRHTLKDKESKEAKSLVSIVIEIRALVHSKLKLGE